MDPAYLELELDAVEARGAGRVPQEMAKSDYTGRTELPRSIHPNHMKQKMRRTLEGVSASITQVLPGKERG